MEIYKKGSKGAVVKHIQKIVGAYQDGVYGDLTVESVKAWQTAHGLKGDGIVGPATMAKMVQYMATEERKPVKTKRKITEIIVHCTSTPEGRDDKIEDVRRWHKEQGWSDIGYHYVIHLDGSVHEGRNIEVSGAHCKNHNAHSIGVVYIGGMDKDMRHAKDTRTEQQKASLLSLLVDLKKKYPDAKIYGHRDFDRRDCPSFDARTEYRNV